MCEERLKTAYPGLMREWAYIDNFFIAGAKEVRCDDPRSVWWICRNCQKRYYMPVSMRTAYHVKQQTACPYCAAKEKREKKRKQKKGKWQ